MRVWEFRIYEAEAPHAGITVKEFKAAMSDPLPRRKACLGRTLRVQVPKQ